MSEADGPPGALEPLLRIFAVGVGKIPRSIQRRLAGTPIELDGQRLDPEVQIALRLAERWGGGIGADSLEEARARLESEARLFRGRRLPATTRDLWVDGAEGRLAARLYAPAPGRPVGDGLIVFFHAGGWTTGGLQSHEQACRFLACEARTRLLAVDYRLAPEHPFPAAAEDAVASFRWAAKHAGELGADRTRLVICGDSAGGNLAAVTSLQTRDDEIGPVLQVLLYPVTDPSRKHPSRELFSEGFLLTDRQMDFYERCYLPDPATRSDPRAAPLLAPDLSGAPPAYIAACGFDPLRDEAIAYAERLGEAGVPVELRVHRGLVHGFAPAAGIGRVAPAAMREVAAAIRAGLAERA